jgi:hypothetical protein
MACIINASTSTGLVQTADLSGVLQLQSNGVAITVPAVAGTMMVSGNMPAFSAYNNASQVITTGTDTKIQFNTKIFDTNTNYDAVTNYRFTPTVAGYYQVTVATKDASGAATGTLRANIWKNGAVVSTFVAPNNTNGISSLTSNLIYMNGSTDYLEGYVFQNSGANMSLASGAANTYFQACLVRGA